MPQRTQTRPGSSGRDRGPTFKDKVRKPGSIITPEKLNLHELHISRKVDVAAMSTKQTDSWNDYLQDLGSANEGEGKPKSLSEMSCSLVVATAMDLKFSPNDQKAVKYRLLKLADKLNKHITEEQSLGFSYMLDVTFAEEDSIFSDSRVADEGEKRAVGISDLQVTGWSGWSEEESLAIEARRAEAYERGILWAAGAFVVGENVEIVDEQHAISLTNNNELYRENTEIRNFIAREMKTTPIKIWGDENVFHPYIPVFVPEGDIILDTKQPPGALILGPPRAFVATIAQ